MLVNAPAKAVSSLTKLIDEPNPPVTAAGPYDLAHAFKYYNDNGTDELAASILDSDITTAKRFMTLAWTTRLVSRGFQLDEKSNASFERLKANLREYKDQLARKEEKRPKFDIQTSIREKAMTFMDAIEIQMDELLHDPFRDVFNWYEFFFKLDLGNGIRPIHVPHILAEIEVAQKYLEQPEAFEPVIKDLKRLASNKVAARAPVKRKVIKADKVVENLQYCKRSDEFKIESINPEALIGSNGLWVFNVKYRDLIFYPGSNITIQGTSLKNIDLDKSGRKVLRKPMETLSKFLDATPKGRQKIFEGVNSKLCKVSNRINKDCVLLKVEK
jgi:hypothetical protein